MAQPQLPHLVHGLLTQSGAGNCVKTLPISGQHTPSLRMSQNLPNLGAIEVSLDVPHGRGLDLIQLDESSFRESTHQSLRQSNVRILLESRPHVSEFDNNLMKLQVVFKRQLHEMPLDIIQRHHAPMYFA